MATDLRGYTEQEVLNKVLNTSSDSIKVDIVSGAEYAEDAAHTTADVGQFVLGVRNDTLAALGGTDGDYVPFQMSADGALYVEIAAGGSASAVYADDADWIDGSSKHMLVGGLYQSSPQSITDGDVGPFQVDADGALHISDGGNTITVDGTVDLGATDNAVLDAIAASLSVLDDWDDSNYANVNMNIAGTDAIGGAGAVASGVQRVTLASDDPAVVDLAAIEVLLTGMDADTDAIKTDMAAIEVLLTAANVDHAANEALLTTIDSDTNDTKNALNNMLYGTALAVTAVHGGSDHALGATYEAFHIGVGGDISLDCATSGTNIVFKNLASGQMLPVRATVVNATNTTATNIVALKA